MREASASATPLPLKRQLGRAAIRLAAGWVPCEILFLLIPGSRLPGEALQELVLDAALVVPVFYVVIHGAWLALSFLLLGAASWRLWFSVVVGAVIGVGLGLIHWQVVLSDFAWWLTP